MIKTLSSNRLILIASLFIVIFDNYDFFSNVLTVYPLSFENIGFLVSIAIVFMCLLSILFTVFSSRFTTKPMLIFSIINASFISYFSNTYSIILDDTMIQNVVETNASESVDLINIKLIFYFIIFGLVPSFFIYKIKIKPESIKKVITNKIMNISLFLLIIVVLLFSFSQFYTSFFREHKPLRYRTNPTYAFYSAGKYFANIFNSSQLDFHQIGLDAKKNTNSSGRKLTIMVVGEAARADRFSLNGYHRETNPMLKKEEIINFPDMYSCGTTTAVSVPCMFSLLDRKNYSDSEAKSTENVLDVLAHAGVKVLWRDNNSSSKGVADRVIYEDYRNSTLNTICEGECRDEGMLVGLQDFVDLQENGDIVIVLHQMGNHGPAYFKRYPPIFEKFKPVCTTNQLEKCRKEDIGNAYDNAILYTDYFLAQTIGFLKQNNDEFQTALIYMGDHGESLGEGGLYLHGMPYFIAPDVQKHVAAFMWFGQRSRKRIDVRQLTDVAAQNFSHDYLFHTLLGLMQIETTVYNKALDILAIAEKTSSL